MAAPSPPAGVVYYGAILTGAPDGLSDLELPISAFSLNVRHATPSYGTITIPRITDSADIDARPNGDIVVSHYERDSTGAVVASVLLTVNLDTVRVDEGATSKSIVLTGNKQTTYTPPFNTVVIPSLSFRTATDGARRWRTKVIPGITPGDTVTYELESFFVGYYSISVSTGGTEAMEIVEGTEIT